MIKLSEEEIFENPIPEEDETLCTYYVGFIALFFNKQREIPENSNGKCSYLKTNQGKQICTDFNLRRK